MFTFSQLFMAGDITLLDLINNALHYFLFLFIKKTCRLPQILFHKGDID